MIKIKKISSSCPAPQEQKGCCPHWGGQGNTGHQTVSMTNTCTVDNFLYTLHLAVKRKPGIKNDLQTNANLDPWICTLFQVHELFEKEWTQGKLLWLNTIGRFKGHAWNAFGTEEDMVVCRLEFLLTTEIVQQCLNASCPVAKRRYNSVDIM